MSTKILIITILIIGIISFIGIINFSRSKETDSPIPEITKSNSQEDNQQVSEGSRYLVYSDEIYERVKDKKRVLFFHAAWCPTCKVADIEFTRMIEKIPQDIILLKTDYDTSTDFKQKYAVTYQHTFVQIDEQGNEVTKWNGGGIKELVENVL